MHAVEQIMANDFAGDGLCFVVQQHDVIAVPAHRTAHVKQQARYIQHRGGDFVGDNFGRVEVTGVEAQRGATAGGITEIEFVRADGVAFGTDTEQFAFNGIDMFREVKFFRNHFIQCTQQTLARCQTIHGDVFHAIRYPDIHDGRCA
ncbi:hypothetical protein D3C80_1559360 [compost metagenome]